MVAGSGVGTVAVAAAKSPSWARCTSPTPRISSINRPRSSRPSPLTGNNIAPRVATLIDVMQISDIMAVERDDTFSCAIDARNAIATAKSKDAKEIITVPGTAIEKVTATGGIGTVEAVDTGSASGKSSFVGAELSKSARPELTSAKITVSGGRALGSGEQFHALINPLADKLGADVGAIRPTVDAGYAHSD